MANGLDERARARPRGADPRGQRAARGHHVLAGIECDIRADGTHGSRRRLPGPARHRDRVGPLRVQPGTGADDRSAAPRARLPVGRHPGPPDRPAAPQARGLPLDMDACSPPRRRHGVAIEINSQVDRLDLNDTHARLARDRGRQARHRLRRAQPGGARQPALGRRRRPPRLADGRRRPQHAAARRAAAAAPPAPHGAGTDEYQRWPRRRHDTRGNPRGLLHSDARDDPARLRARDRPAEGAADETKTARRRPSTWRAWRRCGRNGRPRKPPADDRPAYRATRDIARAPPAGPPPARCGRSSGP